METSDSLLFYTGDIDFQYLDSHLLNYGFKAVYTRDEEEFSKLCLENKYDQIIYNACESDSINNRVLKSLTGTKNINTPILIIAAKEDEEVMNIALSHQFDLVIFPFTPRELIIRLQLALKRKKTEISIHNNLIDHTVLFENFPSGILQTDLNGNFIKFNKELKNILGMSDMDFTGVNFFQLCHPDDYLIERQSLDRMLRKESDTVTFEVRLINNDGKTIVSKISAGTVWKDRDTLDSFIFSIERIG
ncbi:MAG: PAS domain S-box protein [Bacteroidota bacterium]|nr:PAS domain S-box protein [Bacteroidota bacterium]